MLFSLDKRLHITKVVPIFLGSFDFFLYFLVEYLFLQNLFFFSVPKINWSISFWSEKHSSTYLNLLNWSEIYYFHPALLFTQATEWAVGIGVLSVPVPNNFLWVLSFVMDCLLQLHQINLHSLFFKNKAALTGHRILQPLKTMQLSHHTLLNWSKSSFSFPNNSFDSSTIQL